MRDLFFAITSVALFVVPTHTVFAQPASDAQKAAKQRLNEIHSVTGGSGVKKRLPPGDPCTVLSLADIQKVFPNVKKAERNVDLEKYEIIECRWVNSDGGPLFVVQEWLGTSSAKDEARGMASRLVDPTKSQSAKNVRVEMLPSIGVDAAAIVETADAARGIMAASAALFMSNGEVTMMVGGGDMAGKDRTAVLKSLEELGKIAAKRLN